MAGERSTEPEVESANLGSPEVSPTILTFLSCGKSTIFQQGQFSSEEREAVGTSDEHDTQHRLSSVPEDYHQAKKTLNTAVLEHYR